MNDQPKCCSCEPALKAETRAKYDTQWVLVDEQVSAERRKHLAAIADPLLRMILPFSGKTVVDLGVGTGSLAFRAAELSPPELLIGIDFSSSGLRMSRRISGGDRFSSTRFEAVMGDLERLPLSDTCADVILSQASFNLLPDKAAGMNEMARIAKRGARILLSDAFRARRKTEDEPWEACVGGAITVAEFSTLALSSKLFISQQLDLTQQVKALVKSGKWDWPEFVEHGLHYRGFVMFRS
ncbi:MAG: class I SAM-dependent methyltransferase [Methanobacteriota archaeon]|nr:MAG: class I SAM-dependent methyltransferase [Euryarchaeota archaeon]